MVAALKSSRPKKWMLDTPPASPERSKSRSKNDATFKPATLKGSTQTKERGQFYTVVNPFDHWLFQTWFDMIPSAVKNQKPILEPFAGSNNLVKMMEDLCGPQHWACYDIDPSPDNQAPAHRICQRDTFASMPKGHRVAITNPPYLAKFRATNAGLPFPDTKHTDLYKHALQLMLDRVDFVAAIVPASFVQSGLFHHRLFAVIHQTKNLFANTTYPVVLALFVPAAMKKNPADFVLCNGEKIQGWHLDFMGQRERLLATPKVANWTLNDPHGSLAIQALDGTTGRTIRFMRGEVFDPSQVKKSGRVHIRIAGLPVGVDVDRVIEEANCRLAEYRNLTHDAHFTPCLGLRKDGSARRRIPYPIMRSLLDGAVAAVSGSK